MVTSGKLKLARRALCIASGIGPQVNSIHWDHIGFSCLVPREGEDVNKFAFCICRRAFHADRAGLFLFGPGLLSALASLSEAPFHAAKMRGFYSLLEARHNPRGPYLKGRIYLHVKLRKFPE